MKSYTDIEQSKKLAEILPIESADMYYCKEGGLPHWKPVYETDYFTLQNTDIPCWSLAALLSVIPKDEHLTLMMNAHLKWVCDINKTFIYEPTVGDDPLDAVFEMILKLHELKIL